MVRDKIRFKHYSFSTEKTYVHWIKHYILFNHKKNILSKLAPKIGFEEVLIIA
ncbi:phage integrase N-terminal SAM-like domain-containing protein [Sulfurimonas sp. CS5]|uniref:phage integrase N-terminal SAM-like domain-containing protein n=1 Tax=Sulfurimonas sp. CS5 TaxID=3391145 RepID=UPI0039E90355